MPLMHTNNGFLKAATRGDMDVLKSYLAGKHAAEYLKVTDRQGYTALHLAAKAGKLDVIDALVAAGANIEATGSIHYTPLAIAVSSGRTDALRRLLARGADPNGEVLGGATPLSIAASRSSPTAVANLLEAKADPNLHKPLMQAMQYDRTEIVKLLINAGADINIHDDQKRFPLHFAAINASKELTTLLIDKGADIDQRDGANGYSPLQWAIHYNRQQMIELLIEKGANPEVKNNAGQNALQFARAHRNDIAIALLQPFEKVVRPGYDLPDTAENATEKWLPMGDGKVAQVGIYPALERKLTEIFNFESRERIVISENLRTGVENMAAPQSFDTVEEAVLQKAAAAYRNFGNTLDDTQLTRRNLNKTARLP